MNTSNDYSQRNIQQPTSKTPASNATITTDNLDPNPNDSITHLEVWRPFSQLTPPEGCDIIVKTERNSFFAARLLDGEVMRISHGAWIPVIGATKWIPYPHNTLQSYYNKSELNKDMPLEVVFGYLLKEKHDLERQLKEFKCSDHRTVNDDLRLAYQHSETKNTELYRVNAILNRDKHELEDLIATRNDELTKADHDLEECYATIADLKRQLKEQQDQTTLIAYEHRIKELAEQIDSLTSVNKQLAQDRSNLQNTAEQRKQKIKDLEHSISELKKNPKPVIAITPGTDTDYLVKYNLLSTRYTKMRNLAHDILRRCINLKKEHEFIPDNEINEFNVRFDNIGNIATPTPTTKPATVPAASTADDTPTKPRRITIPRSNFLRIPHVGEGTLFLIEPLLNRFNVFLS